MPASVSVCARGDFPLVLRLHACIKSFDIQVCMNALSGTCVYTCVVVCLNMYLYVCLCLFCS